MFITWKKQITLNTNWLDTIRLYGNLYLNDDVTTLNSSITSLKNYFLTNMFTINKIKVIDTTKTTNKYLSIIDDSNSNDSIFKISLSSIPQYNEYEIITLQLSNNNTFIKLGNQYMTNNIYLGHWTSDITNVNGILKINNINVNELYASWNFFINGKLNSWTLDFNSIVFDK